MGKPAARLGDMMSNAGMITGPGAPTVLINKLPAARVGDMHTTPMVTPGTPPIPQVGGPIVGPGCANVLISKMPAAVVGDMATTVGPPGTIMLGSMNVLIGMNGSGGGGGGGGSSTPQAKAAQALQAGTVSPVEGTESYPIEVQALALVMQEYSTPKGEKLDLAVIDAYAEQYQREQEETQKYKDLTIADFVEILKSTESKDGYAGGQHFSGYLNYTALCDKARAFISGEDPDEKNDPNQMPTRFILLYGADDSKLQEINEHPDDAEHKITVENLRKGLRTLGYDVAETGAYDNELYQAHLQYIVAVMQRGTYAEQSHIVREGEELGVIAEGYRLPSWKYLYEVNKEAIGENPDLLKPGVELTIPQWDATSGDEAITEKGGNPSASVGGAVYRYPWQPLSGSFFQPDETEYRKSEEQKEKSGKETSDIEVYSQSLDEIILEREISKHDELSVIVPDCDDLVIRIDGRKAHRKVVQ